jgi:hypothetical protein
MREFERRLQQKFDETCRLKVLQQCVPGERNQPIRGVVDRIKCPWCHKDRWDDGTKCSFCGKYAKLNQGDETAETMG